MKRKYIAKYKDRENVDPITAGSGRGVWHLLKKATNRTRDELYAMGWRVKEVPMEVPELEGGILSSPSTKTPPPPVGEVQLRGGHATRVIPPQSFPDREERIARRQAVLQGKPIAEPDFMYDSMGDRIDPAEYRPMRGIVYALVITFCAVAVVAAIYFATKG